MILQTARDYLNSASNVRLAHLVEIELAGTDGVYSYLTDYMSDLTVNGRAYTAGKVTSVGAVRLTQGLTSYTVSINVAAEYQEELDKATTELSYEGRRINVYSCYIGDNGAPILMDSETGAALVIFQGRITNISLSDNLVSGSARVTWQCAGLLSDFEKVNGRVTDDDSHRGIISGALGPVPSIGAKRPEYQTDTGFLHANQTIATNIRYTALEKEYYLKKSWGGLKTKLREREVSVERELDLKTSLEARYLPVVYGVRKVPGIPVFLDVLKSNPSKMYVVYAFCEGEIESFLNLTIDGISVICGPGGAEEGTGVCMGNTANGDTLGMYSVTQRTQERQQHIDSGGFFSGAYNDFVDSINERLTDYSSFNTTNTNQAQVGTVHGQIINVLAEGGTLKTQFYHGTPNQSPCLELVSLASSRSFLVQSSTTNPEGQPWGSDYWKNSSAGFSGAALLDTAYIVCSFDISEDRTKLPEIEAVVQGRKCRVYSSASAFTMQTTLNPVWHLLDYLTNSVFGAGLKISDLDIDSFISVAEKLDQEDTSYDPSFVKVWRYIGWDSPSGNRSRMQCNTMFATEESVTKLVEGLLDQFGGSLVPYRGKYYLSVQTNEDPYYNLTVEDTIGPISIKSIANKDKWNSIQAAIQDPNMGWGSTQITFFNSQYLAEDNNLRKQGRASFNHITNYYTARSWAEYLLNKSRFSKTVSLTTYFKYFELRPDMTVSFTYPRYGYSGFNTKFRVKEVEHVQDGTIRVELERYLPSLFDPSQQSPTPPGSSVGPAVPPPGGLAVAVLPNPNVLVSIPEGFLGVAVSWSPGNENIMRYDIVLHELQGDNIVSVSNLSVLPTQMALISGVSKVYSLVPTLPSKTYQVKVQGIDKYGSKSPYALATFITGSQVPNTVPRPQGFACTNSTFGRFTGPSPVLVWDNSMYDDTLVDFSEVEILDASTGQVMRSIGTSGSTLTYPLVSNKQDYQALFGFIGASRRLIPRVRNKKAAGVSQWVYLGE